MKIHYISEEEVIAECKKRKIKRISSAYKWLNKNPDKNMDDYVAYLKSKPNEANYKACKEKNLSYNTVRQWINRKKGRTVEGFITKPPPLTQLCKENGINYKNCERWLLNNKGCRFQDYVEFLKKKASRPRRKTKRNSNRLPTENEWIRRHPEATRDDYIKYIKVLSDK